MGFINFSTVGNGNLIKRKQNVIANNISPKLKTRIETIAFFSSKGSKPYFQKKIKKK